MTVDTWRPGPSPASTYRLRDEIMEAGRLKDESRVEWGGREEMTDGQEDSKPGKDLDVRAKPRELRKKRPMQTAVTELRRKSWYHFSHRLLARYRTCQPTVKRLLQTRIFPWLELLDTWGRVRLQGVSDGPHSGVISFRRGLHRNSWVGANAFVSEGGLAR